MIIRKETTHDFKLIYNLVKTAFQTAEVSSGIEQDFVNNLRETDNYIPELSLVADLKGEIIGHIMLSKGLIHDGEKKHEVLYVAPLSVALEYRSKGIGSALMKVCLKKGKELGYSSVFLVGNPNYYHRFGFKTITELGIKYNHEIPSENVMAIELFPNGLKDVTGTIDCF